MNRMQFLLSSDECELLLALEMSKTIEKTAQVMGKDPSGVSRQLSRIAEKYPAIGKCAGKWSLTDIGHRLNGITRSTIKAQQQLVQKQSVLRIGTNREFSSRILAPQLAELSEQFGNTQIRVQTYEFGTEEALLAGHIDIGIDCERPNDPEIAYRLLVDEPIVTVVSHSFFERFRDEIVDGRLEEVPHLLCERLFPDKILRQQDNRQEIAAYFNDIATTRAAAVAGLGWALLPRYSVRDEILDGKLVEIERAHSGMAKYGVWWSRVRYSDQESIDRVCDWLGRQEL